MKWNKDRIFFILLVFLTVWFTAERIQEASFIQSQYEAVSVRLKTGTITERSLETALEKEKVRNSLNLPEVTAWMRIGETDIKNETLNRTIKVSVVIAAGNMALTAPMSLIDGNYVYKEDKKGCVIDTETAYALFGTVNAVGSQITYEKKNYRIRGIVKANYPVFLIQGENDRKEYVNLELSYMEGERGETLTENFLFQNGLATDYVIIDGYFYGRMIQTLTTLPLWLFFFLGGYKILHYYKPVKDKLTQKSFILYGGFVIVNIISWGFFLYQLIGTPFYLPEKLIPTKWSDFDYWSTQFTLIKNQILQIRYLIPNPKDVYLLEEISKLYLNIISMTALYLIIFLYIRMLKKVFPK